MPPPVPASSRLGRIPRVLLIAAGLAFLVIFAGIISFSVWRYRLKNSINSQITAIKKEGLPVDWKDLERWPMAVPDDRNAALVVNRAIGMLDEVSRKDISKWEIPVRGEPLSNEVKIAIAALVKKNSAATAIIHGITNAASSRYGVNYMDGPNAQLPHLAALKQFAWLLADDALLKAEQNDSGSAAKDIDSSVKLSHSLDCEPILISQLVSGAILSISTESLERVLCRMPLSEAQLLQVSYDLSTAEVTNRFWVGLVGERASGNELIRFLQDDPKGFVEMANKWTGENDQTTVPSRNPGVGWRLIGFFDRDRNFFLQAMATNIFALSLGPPKSLLLTNEIWTMETNARKGYYVMSTMLLGSFARVAVRDAETRARLRTAIAGLAVERWRLAHGGRLPNSLSELVPEFLSSVPGDPFDGQTLRFKRLGRGYVIYSVGPNLQDDGGKEKPRSFLGIPRAERDKYDMTFTVER